jgi:uncharacterized protein (DUF1697 family)
LGYRAKIPSEFSRLLVMTLTVFISLLRAVNVGGRWVKMDALRALYESLGFRDVGTYVQSGNVVFRSRSASEPAVSRRIEAAIEERFGFQSSVILRTPSELRGVIERNPFAGRPELEPSKLLVNFLSAEPDSAAGPKIQQVRRDLEELHLDRRELYIYFPDGMGKSKLQMAAVDRALKVPGTGRNWNTVKKLLELGEQLEAL